jgi:hypothetical protein
MGHPAVGSDSDVLPRDRLILVVDCRRNKTMAYDPLFFAVMADLRRPRGLVPCARWKLPIGHRRKDEG